MQIARLGPNRSDYYQSGDYCRLYSVHIPFANISSPHSDCSQPTKKLQTELKSKQESLALASMARDDSPASSTASSTAAAMRGKVGSEFET